MSDTQLPANDAEPLTDDPEILALLDFEPVPRKIEVKGGWNPAKQRAFIVSLAEHGSIGTACLDVDKDRGGVRKLYNSPDGASFRAAWHNAIELAERRRAEAAPKGPEPKDKPPTIDNRRTRSPLPGLLTQGREGESGQVLNEYGEYEDEDSYRQRGEDARVSILNKLVRIRRLFLHEISGNAGKRAAFEILTELPIDWGKAAALEPQEIEPWMPTNQREPDMILTAESGWSFGDIGYGPDRFTQRMAELKEEMDAYHAEHGLPPIDWENEGADD